MESELSPPSHRKSGQRRLCKCFRRHARSRVGSKFQEIGPDCKEGRIAWHSDIQEVGIVMNILFKPRRLV